MSRAGKFRPNGPASSGLTSNGKVTMPSTAMTTSSSPSSNNNKNGSITSNNNNNHSQKDTQNGSPSEVSDEASSSEPDGGPVTLDVELPSGKHSDIVVDYHTPMLDLLVSLAGKCRVNPTNLSLQLLDPDTGKAMAYKPNQTIGSLGGREVRLVPRESKSKNDRKQDKPFEMTHRFTMNLPRGQKTVVRVSPLITLGQLMTSVCEDKSLDLRRHVLQIPGQPGVKVDLASTIQELGRHELNLVAVGLQDPRSHMVSMPDLSKPPAQALYMNPRANIPPAGEPKKKRGFLSFLSKNKDKKYRQNIETSSTTSHVPRGPHPPPVTRQASTPPAQRRELSESPRRPHHPDTRPKTMFIAAPGDHQNMDAHSHTSQQQKHQLQQPMDVTAGTGKKKRRAPAPPGPSAPAKEHRAQTHNGGHLTTEPLHERVEGEARQQQQQPLSRADVLSRLHSRNSSDSSGYHELPLSGAESPEAPGFYDHQTQHQDEAADKLKSSTASISSGHDSSGANGDSGVHDLSPMRVSPIREVSEKSDVPSVSASAPAAGGGKKKRKAPAPPAPPSSSQPSRPLESLATTTTITTTADVPPLNVRAVEPELQAKLERPVETESSQSSEEPSPRDLSTPDASVGAVRDNVDTIKPPPASAGNGVTEQYKSNNEVDFSDEDDVVNENTAFDINDILAGVVLDEGPMPMELKLVGSERDQDNMVMEETASIISETAEQVEISKNERPCAFIPPPPPDEPPPPEVEPVEDIVALTRKSDPVLVDKGTGVNEDNTSLAPSSAKSSPGADRKRRASFTSMGSVDTIEGLSMDFQQAIQMGQESLEYLSVDDVAVPSSYKSEMALFVERMSKVAVETISAGGSGQNDDSVSSLSLPASENSDTGSVIQHVRTGSQDSRVSGLSGVSGSDSGGSLRGLPQGAQPRDKAALPMTEEINVPLETVPPPPEFGDEEKIDEKKDGDDDDEYYTETVEELIIPLTSHGYDFSAAQKVSDAGSAAESQPSPREEQRARSGSTGVFRAEPVSIAPVNTGVALNTRPPTPPVVRPPTPPAVRQPSPPASSSDAPCPSSPPAEPKGKEEFVLTLEDLDSVSFLAPKAKSAKSTASYKPETPASPGFVSSTAIVMEKQDKQGADSPRGRTAMTSSKANPEDNITETKSMSIYIHPPTMRAGGRAESRTFAEDLSPRSDDSSLDPLINKLSPRLLVGSNSATHKHRSGSTSSTSTPAAPAATKTHPAEDTPTGTDVNSPSPNGALDVYDQVDTSVPDSDAADKSTDSSVELDPQEALAAQYSALQAQFAQWQTQLNQNQALLTAQTSPGVSRSNRAAPEIKAEQLQQLSDQVLVQQQMMQQLQQTMQALQQQQSVQVKGSDDKTSSSTAVEVAQASPPPPPPPPPPPAPSSQGAPKGSTAMPKVRTLDSPRPAKPTTARQSRFEPVLDPREELMLAIRGFKGREGLRSVSVNQTKWIHSNR